MEAGGVSERLLAYRLLEPGARDRHAAALGMQLQSIGPGRLVDPAFHHEPTGAFKLFDHGRLWRNQRPDLLAADESAARRQAADYLAGVNRSAARYRASRNVPVADYPDPFPVAALRHDSTRLQVSPRTGRADHWLSVWRVELPVAERGHRTPVTGQVLGANVELRLGPRGQVVAAVARSRPWTAIVRRSSLPPPSDEHDELDDHYRRDDKGAGHPAEPRLCYVQETGAAPQRYLSPAWVVPPPSEVHDHAAHSLYPACDLTLFIEIDVDFGEERAIARAIALGAAGARIVVEHGRDWRVTWRASDLDGFARGEPTVRTRSMLGLDRPGLYHVELMVEDLVRDNVSTTYAQVPVARREGRPAPRADR